MRTDLNELRSFLTNEFNKKLEYNSSYSKNSFARDIGISATSLNEFLSKKRELSFKNIDTIFKYLNSKLHCSWCDKEKGEVDFLIGGPRNQYICNDCVDRCNQIAKSGKKIDS